MITLVDTTLRDGSYRVGFGFTGAQTFALVQGLEAVGIPAVEAGHGLGLGAWRAPGIASAEDDLTYMQAARMAARNAKVGVFAMPKFAVESDIDAAAEAGMDFIRIGMDAARYEQGEALVRRARANGLHTLGFLMKSYTLPVEELRIAAPRIAEWGADGFLIVDSAGGMTPDSVRAYVRAVIETTGKPCGFHGHNNLELAVGNAFAAVEAGATILDASLKGLGRSSGNASLEALTAALNRAGHETGIDPVKLARLADKHVRNADLAEWNEADLVQGMAYVHSGMQDRIDALAADYSLDPAALTLAAGAALGGLDLTDDQLAAVARDLAGHADIEEERAVG